MMNDSVFHVGIGLSAVSLLSYKKLLAGVVTVNSLLTRPSC